MRTKCTICGRKSKNLYFHMESMEWVCSLDCLCEVDDDVDQLMLIKSICDSYKEENKIMEKGLCPLCLQKLPEGVYKLHDVKKNKKILLGLDGSNLTDEEHKESILKNLRFVNKCIEKNICNRCLQTLPPSEEMFQ